MADWNEIKNKIAAGEAPTSAQTPNPAPQTPVGTSPVADKVVNNNITETKKAEPTTGTPAPVDVVKVENNNITENKPDDVSPLKKVQLQLAQKRKKLEEETKHKNTLLTLQQERDALKAKEKYADLFESVKRDKKQFNKVLDEIGMTYQDFIDMSAEEYIRPGTKETPKPQEINVEEIIKRAKEEALKEVETKTTKEKNEIQLQQVVRTIKDYISKEKETFPCLNLYPNAAKEILDLSKQHLEVNGKALHLTESAKLIEEELFREYSKQIEVFKRIPKLSKLLMKQEQTEIPIDEKTDTKNNAVNPISQTNKNSFSKQISKEPETKEELFERIMSNLKGGSPA